MTTPDWYVAGAGALVGGLVAVFAWPAPDLAEQSAPLVLLAIGVVLALVARLRRRRREFD